jgi:hypothetical protein
VTLDLEVWVAAQHDQRILADIHVAKRVAVAAKQRVGALDTDQWSKVLILILVGRTNKRTAT